MSNYPKQRHQEFSYKVIFYCGLAAIAVLITEILQNI